MTLQLASNKHLQAAVFGYLFLYLIYDFYSKRLQEEKKGYNSKRSDNFRLVLKRGWPERCFTSGFVSCLGHLVIISDMVGF